MTQSQNGASTNSNIPEAHVGDHHPEFGDTEIETIEQGIKRKFSDATDVAGPSSSKKPNTTESKNKGSVGPLKPPKQQ
ncbi:hypothetical protein EUTSA_v10029105mg [Eutrema salsugineum]|uniref:Uncharacterized protein n=1 Tax=Eutrema salsugineum TaxID=72664 RepID=V4MZU1_EUTSA|nr:hypothetical protein EUTSA_v10029105mg [Eutrema salsugineum]